MTDSRSRAETRPDARLVGLHAERGDPHVRLSSALAALEGTGWGLLLPGEAALARQLAAVLGQGTVRVDSRLRLNRDLLAVAGLAAAPLDGDWRGARAVWLLEPEAGDIERARRAGVPVIADATLAPGGGWLGIGAELIVYRDGATLTGHGDVSLAVLFGAGTPPEPVTDPPSELSVALALRDVSTLPLRLARAARTVATLADRLGGAAQGAGPTALLLAPDAAPDTAQPPGGVRAAARSVPAGVILTPGLEEADTALGLLYGHEPQGRREEPQSSQSAMPEQSREDSDARQGRTDGRRDNRRDREGRRDFRPRQEGRSEERRDDSRHDFRQGDRPERGERPSAPSHSESRRAETTQPQSSQPQPDPSRPTQGQDSAPERFTFEAPAASSSAASPAQAEESWEPEIVYSDLNHPPVRVPTPISSGPDASPLDAGIPDVRRQPERTPAPEEHDAPDSTTSGDSPSSEADHTAQHGAAPEQARPEQPPRRGNGNGRQGRPPRQEPQETPDATPVILPPDLPAAKEDPAANLSDEQAAVYARLREWRNAEAKRQEISRFIIASNATLAEIARRVPYTDADLKAVKGMGPERMKKYGDKILEVVRG